MRARARRIPITFINFNEAGRIGSIGIELEFNYMGVKSAIYFGGVWN